MPRVSGGGKETGEFLTISVRFITFQSAPKCRFCSNRFLERSRLVPADGPVLKDVCTAAACVEAARSSCLNECSCGKGFIWFFRQQRFFDILLPNQRLVPLLPGNPRRETVSSVLLRGKGEKSQARCLGSLGADKK